MSVKLIKSKEKISELRTTSKKTLEFYEKNKNLDFVEMNDLMVELLDKLITNINGELTNSMTKDLMNTIKTISNDMNMIKESMEKSNKDIITNILIKMYEQKTEFINEIRLMIDKSDNDNLLKIIDKMERDQTKMINEIIPKSNNEYYEKYDMMLKTFKEDIKNTTQINLIEQKHTDMLKNIEVSLMNHVCKTEERLQNNMNDIKTQNIISTEIQKELNSNLTTHLNKYNNSTLKGQLAENKIEEIISNLYKSSDIIKTTKDSKSGDLILNRINMEPLLFEVKDYTVNVPLVEIDKFIRDVNEHNISGIMLSISSGIANKKNFQIDITKNNNICIYIHNMNYDVEKLRLAIDIIDNLGSKLKENKNSISITSEIIEQINSDYQTFILKRDLTLNHIKESTKKTIQYIEEMELKNLNNYLTSKFSFKNSSTLKCDLCNNFIGTNLKSIAVHKRKCKGIKNIENNKSSDTNSDEELNKKDIII
jgi:hypothetical protein